MGGSEINIEAVTLVKRDTSAIDDVIDNKNAEIISAEYMNPLGVVKNTPHKGLNIVRYTYSDGNEVIIKILF